MAIAIKVSSCYHSGDRASERLACADTLAAMGRFLADTNAGPRIDVHAAFRGSKVGNKMHGATGTPRPERVCPFLAAASAAGVKLPTDACGGQRSGSGAASPDSECQ